MATPPAQRSDEAAPDGGLKVVVAEDSVLLREGIAQVLREHGFDVVAEVGDLDSVLEAVEQHDPDVVVTDIRMPPEHRDEGLRAAEKIHSERPGTGVLVLSQYVEPRTALKLMTSNPSGVGYILKDTIAEVSGFISVVRRVAAGESAVDPAVVEQLVARSKAKEPLNTLSSREMELLSLMAEGRSNSAICERLFLSPKTVETHVSSIFAKLGLPPAADDHRRVLAVLEYLRSFR